MIACEFLSDDLDRLSLLLLTNSPLMIYFSTHPPGQFRRGKKSQSKDIISCYLIFASSTPNLVTNKH